MTAIKERPILFNSAMVRAILSGQKTVTRRVVKGIALDWLAEGMFTPKSVAKHSDLCPYGQPGDRLWVREAWARIHIAQAPDQEWVVYREGDNLADYGGPWKPSIHMRRRDSRILLEITDVRVERLQDISEAQAASEGVEFNPAGDLDENPYLPPNTALEAFRSLWIQIHSSIECWNRNPWVWVVEFKRASPA